MTGLLYKTPRVNQSFFENAFIKHLSENKLQYEWKYKYMFKYFHDLKLLKPMYTRENRNIIIKSQVL